MGFARWLTFHFAEVIILNILQKLLLWLIASENAVGNTYVYVVPNFDLGKICTLRLLGLDDGRVRGPRRFCRTKCWSIVGTSGGRLRWAQSRIYRSHGRDWSGELSCRWVCGITRSHCRLRTGTFRRNPCFSKSALFDFTAMIYDNCRIHPENGDHNLCIQKMVIYFGKFNLDFSIIEWEFICETKKKIVMYPGLLLTELVLFQRSEKSILVKTTRFCIFQRFFKTLSKFQKSETSNLL